MKHQNLTTPITLITVFIAFLVLTLGSVSAAPLVSGTPGKGTPNPTKVAIQAARCELVTKRIQDTITKFDTNKDKHIEQYKNIHDRVADLITKLKAKGYDVTKLQEDLTVLDTKRQAFVDAYTDFVNGLKAAQDFECGKSNGDFKSAVESARGHFTSAREISLDIRTFILGTLKVDIQAIKAQKVSN